MQRPEPPYLNPRLGIALAQPATACACGCHRRVHEPPAGLCPSAAVSTIFVRAVARPWCGRAVVFLLRVSPGRAGKGRAAPRWTPPTRFGVFALFTRGGRWPGRGLVARPDHGIARSFCRGTALRRYWTGPDTADSLGKILLRFTLTNPRPFLFFYGK